LPSQASAPANGGLQAVYMATPFLQGAVANPRGAVLAGAPVGVAVTGVIYCGNLLTRAQLNACSMRSQWVRGPRMARQQRAPLTWPSSPRPRVRRSRSCAANRRTSSPHTLRRRAPCLEGVGLALSEWPECRRWSPWSRHSARATPGLTKGKASSVRLLARRRAPSATRAPRPGEDPKGCLVAACRRGRDR
jgi:hypothetical protein